MAGSKNKPGNFGLRIPFPKTYKFFRFCNSCLKTVAKSSLFTIIFRLIDEVYNFCCISNSLLLQSAVLVINKNLIVNLYYSLLRLPSRIFLSFINKCYSQ